MCERRRWRRMRAATRRATRCSPPSGSGAASPRSSGPHLAAPAARTDRGEVSTTLDQYCETHGISPDWIKIDAEGAEPLIVQGMQRLIGKQHPSVILEFHSRALTDAERREAWSAITGRASSVEFLQSRPNEHTYLEELHRGLRPGLRVPGRPRQVLTSRASLRAPAADSSFA